LVAFPTDIPGLELEGKNDLLTDYLAKIVALISVESSLTQNW
jgi:hypothetical protein